MHAGPDDPGASLVTTHTAFPLGGTSEEAGVAPPWRALEQSFQDSS